LEEQFYLVWPLLILLTPRTRIKQLFLATIVLAPFIRLAIYLFYQYQPWFEILRQDPNTALYTLPFTQWDSFAFGALLTVLPRLPRARLQFLILLFGLPALGLLTDYLTTGAWNLNNGFGLPLMLPNAYKSIWGYSLLNYLFLLLLYGVAREGWFLRLLEHPAMRYLGRISYGLYVYHLVVIWMLRLVIFPHVNRYLLAIPALAIVILIASASYYFFEKPVMDLKDRWFAFKPAQAAPLPAGVSSMPPPDL
jgi:peptidoglycan/LPS O-acetylase OafA/YrhL